MNELTLDEAAKMILLREKQDVALVMGQLSSWVPDPTKVRYFNCILKMRNDWGYCEAEINNWVGLFVGDSKWDYPALYPCGRVMEPDYFTETVGFVAHVRWASDMEPENGIYHLAGDYARRGYMQAKNLTGAGAKVTNLTVLVSECVHRLNKLNADNPPTWRTVLNNLDTYDHPVNPTVEDIDHEDELIIWADGKGKARSTSFGQFRNLITQEKKRINS
jgi:hypothetical protein